MARAHFWQYLTNTEGQPIVAANIGVYNAGGEGSAAAYVFKSETGDDPSNIIPQIVTDSEGYFEFWVADHTEVNGYAAGSKFKITWEKTGSIEPGEINNVDIWIDKNKASVYQEDFDTADFTIDGGNQYVDVIHNLNEPYPMVICYDATTETSVAITFKHVDDNTTRVWRVTTANSCHITIIG
jgi:hypothetical protein